MRRSSIFVIVCGLLACVGCGTKSDSEKDATSAAGHPDELRDSTRLDPAKVAIDSSLLDSVETPPSGPVDTVESPDSPE